ncbi:hypothetical protein SLA2020_492940 [Shorea laevis]
MSPSPFPLLAISAIILLLLLLPTAINHHYAVQKKTRVRSKLLLSLLTFLLIFAVKFSSRIECSCRFLVTTLESFIRNVSHIPWGLLVLLLGLLVMVKYQTYFQSILIPYR